MYCNIELAKMEIFTLIFHFLYRSYLYSEKQEKHNAKTWKITACTENSNMIV